MKFNKLTLPLVILTLTICLAVSAQGILADQMLRQKMEMAAKNLTTYAFSRSAEADILYENLWSEGGDPLYRNLSLQENLKFSKSTEGKVDLINQSGMWSSNLTDEQSGKVLSWTGYYINGSEYWKIDKDWTKLSINNTTEALEDINELPSQVNLIKYSDMKTIGSEAILGENCGKLVGSPIESIGKEIIGHQLMAAYSGSPIPLPENFENGTVNFDATSLMNNSNITMTAWVSENSSLLRRLDINSELVITPEILNISSPDFRIVSRFNESTVYNDFGVPIKIELPKPALKSSSKELGVNWRWAIFGSIRP
jgi:hypothetical protein